MIRPAAAVDTPTLLQMTAATGYFKPMEVDALQEVLDDYHDREQFDGNRCFVLEEAGSLVGFVYHAPEPMTEGSWSLWWIVVRPDAQGKGHGGMLLDFVEGDACRQGARMLFVETSGLPLYESTRQFYLRNGYHEEARVRDYYAEGDDQIYYRKRFATLEKSPGRDCYSA